MAQGDNVGDVLRPPGTTQKAEVKIDEILASYARFTQEGCTLAANQGVLLGGTVLGKVTATKRYKAYVNGAVDGTEVALGVLRKTVDTAGEEKLGNIVLSGILKNSKLVGMDAAAVTDLNGRIDAGRDWFIF